MDIRALPELSDEDLIYLGISEPLQRRKLLQVARALKKGNVQRLKGVQSTAPALQPAEIPAACVAAQLVASATSAARSDSHDSRTHTQGDSKTSAAVGGPSLACDSGSCRVTLQPTHTQGKAKAEPAGLQPAGDACRGLEHSLARSAGTKRLAGDDIAAVPQGHGDADFAEQPARHTGPPPKKFAKLSRSMLSRRKTDRPVSKACSVPTAAAAAKQHLSAGSSLQDMASKEQSAVLQGMSKAHSMPSSATAPKHHLSSDMGRQDPASQENMTLPAYADKAHSKSSAASPVPKPEQGSCTFRAANRPARPKALPAGGEPKQATRPGGQSASEKDEPQPSEDIKPAAYLSGALGHLLATR